VTYIFFLPLLVYGFHLALAGDMSLLFITTASFLIALVPNAFTRFAQLTEQKNPEVSEGFPDRLDYLLPDFSITADVAVEGPAALCRSLVRQLFRESKEELWCLSDCLECFETFHESNESISEFISRIENRASVAMPFNVVLEAQPQVELEAAIARLADRPFRLITLGFSLPTSSSKFLILDNALPARVVAEIEGIQQRLILSENSLTCQPANDFGDYRAPSGSSLNLIGNSSGKHRASSRDKSKGFNFPLRRNVINKAKPSFRRLTTQNQVSEGLSEQVGSSDAISDITTRLRQLGHGI
jgi:hypothetical protein